MTMTDHSWLSLIRQYRAIAVIRTSQLTVGRQMAMAAAAGGLRLIEVTWNSDQAPELVRQLGSALPDCTIGAGTLLNLDQAQQVIAAGAKFIFTPHVDPALICTAREKGIAVIPGALSPTEIVMAWQAGASSVKVFPVEAMGGTHYIQSLQAPLGHIPLIPTGGVTLKNAKEFIHAGAIGVGLAGSLFPKPDLEIENWSAITERAKMLVQCLGLAARP